MQNDVASVLHSPILRAVWGYVLPEDFVSEEAGISDGARDVFDTCVEMVRGHKRAQNLHDQNGKVSEEVLEELGSAGYWGLLAPVEYGGAGVSCSVFVAMLTRMATVDPTIAGLAAVHSCIGAMGTVRQFGNEEQKSRLLPRLARGETLGVFALTEPNAGSDLTALRTTARLEGDHFLVNGEKLFITNLALGRTLAIVCLIDSKPAVLIAELPREANATFELREYGLWALKHTCNRGIVFRDFPVPRENLLVPPNGNGLAIAYHGLNLGRTALCANAAGSLRIMLANMLPWVKFRQTYGQPLANRELVQRRIGELASLIVGCDALTAWCAGLIDRGVRCEMECITAKVFASEALKYAAIELALKTHGGRAFLHGHPLGDHLYDYLAPLIYEGEGDMLSLAFFKSLVKPKLKGFVSKQPSGKMKSLDGQEVTRDRTLPQPFAHYIELAQTRLSKLASDIYQAIRKFGIESELYQNRFIEMSQECQLAVSMLATASSAIGNQDDLIRSAKDVLCQRQFCELSDAGLSDAYFHNAARLGNEIIKDGFPSINYIPPQPLMMQY